MVITDPALNVKAKKRLRVLSGIIALGLSASVQAGDIEALGQMSLEQLMDVEIAVEGASKYSQGRDETPASVSVVTAQDIKDYGYRTLADVLQSIRGLNVTYDRVYRHVSVRGYGQPDDYNPRILLLIDGYRSNDPVYDQAFLGPDFLLDPELIERVEFIPGAGSAMYGSNAFLGVVNVVTKNGQGVNAVEAAGEIRSYGTDKERLTWGKRFDNGLDVLVSGSHYDSDGQDLHFREFDRPETNHGVAKNLDGDRAERLFGKLSWDGFYLEAGFADRKKFLPTAQFGSTFNEGPNFYHDVQAFFNVRYQKDLTEHLNLSAQAFHGRYDYDGTYPFGDAPPFVLNRDETKTRWAGGELRLVSTHFDHHHLMLGGEYQNNWRQDQANFDIDPRFVYIDSRQDSERHGVYFQDDISLFDPLHLSLGARWDHYSTTGDTYNPRLAAIYKYGQGSSVKLLYGTAFRAPNQYEMFYASDPAISKGNTGLMPETTRSWELAWEHRFDRRLRLTASGFRYEIDDLIQQVVDPADNLLQFQNIGRVESWGAELEGEYRWDSGVRLRASYAWLHTRDGETGERVLNSPGHLVKFNLSAPLWQERLRAGVETQFTGEAPLLNGDAADSYPLVNLTLRSDKLFERHLPGFEVSGSVYNLLDEKYAVPAGDSVSLLQIPQDGRNFRVLFTYRY